MTLDIGRVGVWSPVWSWEEGQATEAAAELDELGFGALWLGGCPGDLYFVESLLAASNRIVLASGIVNVWTEPVDVAIDAYRRVAAHYPERLLLGVGAGHKEPVERMTGQQYTRPYHKVVSYLDALDAADPPVPSGSRALAALGPRMLALAGQRTLGAHPYLVTPEHTRWAREILGPGPLLAPEQKVVLETDPEAARDIARRAVARYLALPNYTNNLVRLGFTEADLTDGGSDRLVDALVAVGSTQAVADRVREHHQAGADHVCIQVLTRDGPPSRESFRALAGALLD